MSRLIDADMLSPDRDYYDNGGYDAVSCQQIDYATTVKAIPLDKVKEAREEIASSLNGLDEWDYAEKVAKFYIERDLRILDELIESEG
jgi:DNA-directed RNA polymerase subunit F